jgi:hypothetical protein
VESGDVNRLCRAIAIFRRQQRRGAR